MSDLSILCDMLKRAGIEFDEQRPDVIDSEYEQEIDPPLSEEEACIMDAWIATQKQPRQVTKERLLRAAGRLHYVRTYVPNPENPGGTVIDVGNVMFRFDAAGNLKSVQAPEAE